MPEEMQQHASATTVSALTVFYPEEGSVFFPPETHWLNVLAAIKKKQASNLSSISHFFGHKALLAFYFSKSICNHKAVPKRQQPKPPPPFTIGHKPLEGHSSHSPM